MKKRRNKIGVMLLCICMLMCGFCGCSSGDSSSSDTTNAKICAKKAVQDELKSPSTATFCQYTDMTATSLGDDRWKVTGYVDAENSFGAVVRQNWSVTLTLTDSGFKDYSVSFY